MVPSESDPSERTPREARSERTPREARVDLANAVLELQRLGIENVMGEGEGVMEVVMCETACYRDS
jgi:hypothetical protein